MSAPVPLSYAEKGNCTERKKDRSQNNVTPSPGEACAEERQGGEQSKVSRRLGVHFPGPHAPWLLLRRLADEFAFRRISKIDVRVLPIQIEHHWQDIAASTPLLPCADYLAVTKAQD